MSLDNPKFPNLDRQREMQKARAAGLPLGKLENEPDDARRDTKGDRLAAQPSLRDRAEQRQADRDAGREQRKEEARESQKRHLAEREAELPPVGQDPKVMEALVAAKPNLKEGAPLNPPADRAPFKPTPVPASPQAPRGRAGDSAPTTLPSRKWGVTAVDGGFDVVEGEFYVSASTTGTITDSAGVFTPAASNCLYLEIDNSTPTQATLIYGSVPASVITVTGSGDSEAMDKYRKILATFDAFDLGGGKLLFDGVWINYRTADSDLLLINSLTESPNSSARVIGIVELVPL